ncbi:IclR family transcriptional regulator [Longispora albida]|uniref:IclR family transcriptional regulator n=1 Tax=Longispora albida TaxID=203523 RepID=UPI000688CA93|nr:helix-turn-helix domain-containing protein [Longispora albida]
MRYHREPSREAGSEPPPDLIRSVSRAFRIIEAVGDTEKGLTPKQIARRCELNLATVYHLVRTLSYEGYLHRRENGTFVAGLNFSDRYREMTKAFSAPANVADGLRRAAGRTGHSHFLGQFINGRVAITGVAEGARSPHMEDLIVGFDDGAHATALGKALLSSLSAPARGRYLRESGMRRYTAKTITEHDKLEYELSVQGGRGLFVEVEQYRRDVACAATVVAYGPEPDQVVVLATTLPLQEFVTTASTVNQRIRAAAQGLASALSTDVPGITR